MQTFELWRHETDYSFFPESNVTAREQLPEGAIKIWTIAATSWNEACAKRNEYLGWGPHEPMDDDSE